MIVEVDAASAVPPYEQLRAQVETLIDSWVLEPGAQLPSIRQLAGDLGLAAGTVARAYRELEAAGLVVSNRRHGTRVADSAGRPPINAAERRRRLREAARAYALAARQLGADPADAVTQARAALDAR